MPALVSPSITALLVLALAAPASPRAISPTTPTPELRVAALAAPTASPRTTATGTATATPTNTATPPTSPPGAAAPRASTTPVPSPAVAPAPAPGDMSSRTAQPAVEGPAPAPAPAIHSGICHGSRPCKRLVTLGAVTGALGVTTIIAGAVVAARPTTVDSEDPTMAIAYRPAGTAVLTIGIGVLATSVLMALAAARAGRHAGRHGTLARRSVPAAHTSY